MTPKSLTTGLALLATAWLSPTLSAQSTDTNGGQSMAQLLDAWRTQHGPEWLVQGSHEHNYARMLFGGSAQGSLTPQSDADFFALARGFASDLAPMFAVTEDQLVDDEVVFLGLHAVGTTDKVTVRLEQAVNGVPVENGSVNVLMTPGGDLLSYASRALPIPAGFDTVPSIDAGTALDAAVQAFNAKTGTPVTSSSLIELNIVGEELGALGVQPTLAWRVQLWNEAEGFVPESFTYQIAAHDAPRVVREDNAIHHFDVGGTVVSNSTPGTRPDVNNNQPTQQPMSYMTVTASGVGTTTTDVNGDFNFPGVTGPVSVTFRYNGTYNNVDNESGAEYSLTQSLTGTGNLVVMNPSPSENVTAQSNAFLHVNLMRDWTRAIMPTDNNMDFVNDADCNINSSCNAFYDGNSTNYYTSGSGCVNTSYSSVIYHEQGHWQNDRYNSGNGSDGFGEGNADIFAMYQNNNPIVGEEFFGQGGGFVRSGLNNRQFCGDTNPGCYGGVHADGEVLMGAAWKVRANLQAVNGDAAGGLIADTLFLGWMNAYDQGTIRSIIETQWLTLDDDNGNINDGTPNWQEINDGFLEQGFPGFFPNGAPTASFTSDTTGGSAPLTVNFSDTSVGNTILAWSWDFGDGSTSTAQNPTHTYLSGGTYDVSLTVTNDIASDTTTVEDYIMVIPGGPASVTSRNGSGTNPDIFASTDLPLLGETWTSTIDGGSVGATGLTFVFGYQAPLTGLPTAFGELLVDTTSPFGLLNTSFLIGGTATHNESVPFDVSLVGFTVASQGFLNNVGGSGQLTNALDLVLGTF